MEYGSVGGKVMTHCEKSYRRVMMPMIKQQDVTKSRDDDGSMPMADVDGCRCRWRVICR